MRRVRLRRIGLRSIFLLFLVLYGGVGLAVGAGLYLLAGAGVVDPALTETVGMTALDRLGAWSLVLFPALYGLVGGIAGAVGAALYNLAATVTGGLRLELEDARRVEVEGGGGGAEEAGAGGPEDAG